MSWAIIFAKFIRLRRVSRQSERFVTFFRKSKRFSEVNTFAGELSDELKIDIEPGEFFLDPGGTLQQGYVEITSSVRLAGSVVFGDAGSRGFTTSLPLASKLQGQLVFSQVASDATYFTGLALLNPGDTEASAVIQVFDFGGSVIVSRIETIPPKGRKSKLLTEFFPALERENISSGYITVTVNRNIAAFGLFGDRRLTVLSAVPPQVVP